MIISLLSIENNCFPDKLKEAQVTPIFKKSDPLMKTNYRPVSVLPIFSKIFFLTKRKISFINTLNNNGSSIEPCATPLWMSAQPLRTLLTFICCFRFDK
jgi:hypothetical protein